MHGDSAIASLRTRIRAWFLHPDEARVRWRRVVGICTATAFALYLGLTAFIFWLVRHHWEANSVRLAAIAAPWHWNGLQVARGDYRIRAAGRFAAEGKFREALIHARRGVAQSPANRDGRLLLADLLGGLERPEFMRRTLFEGLQYHSADPVYLRRLLTFLLAQQEDNNVVNLARARLARLPADCDAARLLALAAATASYFRGNYDQADDFLRGVPRLTESRDGRLLVAKIEKERGYPELALVQMRQLAAEIPLDVEIHRELVNQLQGRGLDGEARRSLVAFQIAQPNLPEARVALLQAYRNDGDTSSVGREIDALLQDSATSSDVLFLLAEFGASSGDIALVRRVAGEGARRRLPETPYTLLAIEAAIVAGDYASALETTRRCAAEQVGARSPHLPVFDSLRAIAYAGAGDTSSARASLNNFLTHRNLRAENLLAVANRLAALNGGELAHQTLRRAVEIDPLNQAALARLIELDLLLNRVDDLPGHVERFVRMRRPSPQILRVAYHKMGSDLFLFSRDPPAALRRIRESLKTSGESQ